MWTRQSISPHVSITVSLSLLVELMASKSFRLESLVLTLFLRLCAVGEPMPITVKAGLPMKQERWLSPIT